MSSIYFTDQGKGQAVVLIHGFCETRELWSDFAHVLSKNFRVICLDLPGFGKSKLADDSIQLEEVAVLLEEWMEEHQIDNPIVIGHSLGGYLALALLELMGRKLKAIGLFHSTAFADDEEKKSMRDRTVLFLKKYGVDTFVTYFIPPLIPEARREELKEELTTAIAQAKQSTLRGLIAFTLAMRDRKDRFHVLENFSGPKLMIAGTEDGAVKIEASRQHKTVVSDYFELENTGHLGMIEQKELTLKIIEEFCEKVTT
jgi:pimeloyl-ACP methyl ester carboxylesterase